MKTFQNRLSFLPLHQLTFHNYIRKELIFYEKVEKFTPDVVLKKPTLLTFTSIDSFYGLFEKDEILRLVQDPNIVSILLCSHEHVVIDKEILTIFTQCEIPIVQLYNESSLHIFKQDDELLFSFNFLGSEISEIHEKDIRNIAINLAEILETPLFFLNNKYEIIWKTEKIKEQKIITKWLDEHRKELTISKKMNYYNDSIVVKDDYLFFPINNFADVYYKLLTKKHLVSWQRQLIAKLVNLVTVNRQTNLKVKSQLAIFEKHFIHDLLYNNFTSKSLLIEQGESLGWDLRKSYHLFLIDIELSNESLPSIEWMVEIGDYIESQSGFSNHEMIHFRFDNQYVVLLEDMEGRKLLERKEFALRIAKELHKLITENWPSWNFNIGIGNYYPSADELHKSYQEAKLSLNFMEHWFKNKVLCHFSNLGIYRLLLYVPKEILNSFSEEILFELIKSDKNNDTEYINTLQSYYESNGNLNEASEKIYIHPNTLRNRMKRIEEITGLNAQSPEGCINLNMALKILTFNQKHL